MMKFTDLAGRSVWITGASSGIGLELAMLAAEFGAHLTLFSSRRDALSDAARLCAAKGAASVHFEAVDLSVAEAASQAALGAAERHGAPDFLLLNAGISQRSLAADTDLEVTRRIIDVNFFGAVAVARAILPAMVAAGGGRIGVTSSLTGAFGFPLRSAYAASKHALHGYFETLGLEYASAGIRTTLVLPGRIRTSIARKSLTGDGSPHDRRDPGLERGMDPRTCAERYWKAVLRGRPEALIGGAEILMVVLRRRIPWLFRLLARRVSPV